MKDHFATLFNHSAELSTNLFYSISLCLGNRGNSYLIDKMYSNYLANYLEKWKETHTHFVCSQGSAEMAVWDAVVEQKTATMDFPLLVDGSENFSQSGNSLKSCNEGATASNRSN